jgi:hypothetical protein
MSYTSLWGDNVLPWQLPLPWQYALYAYLLETSVAEFTITGIGVLLGRIYELIAISTAYVITGIDVNFNRLRNMAVSVGEYTITGVNTWLNKCWTLTVGTGAYLITGVNINVIRLRNLVASVSRFIIQGNGVNFRGFGNWVWSRESKPTLPTWTNNSKPSDPTWTNQTKFE